MLQWILEEAQERKEPLDNVAMRLQLQNFAAIHTSSSVRDRCSVLYHVDSVFTYYQSLTHAFFHMLAKPDIIPILREEVQNTLSAEGWTKNALDKMWKLDSLLRESQRYTGITLREISPFLFSTAV